MSPKLTGYEKIPHAVYNTVGCMVSRPFCCRVDAELSMVSIVEASIYKASFFFVAEIVEV